MRIGAHKGLDFVSVVHLQLNSSGGDLASDYYFSREKSAFYTYKWGIF